MPTLMSGSAAGHGKPEPRGSHHSSLTPQPHAETALLLPPALPGAINRQREY